MGSYNKVLLMGNLTRDVEVRYTPNTNTAIANLGLAVNRRWRDQSGELKEEVTFVDCEAWGKTAENISKFFSKGKPIFIEGRLRLDSWQDKNDGSKRSKLKVVVDTFEFVESRGGDGGGGGGEGAGGAPRANVRTVGQARPASAPSAPAQPAYEEIREDDIPF